MYLRSFFIFAVCLECASVPNAWSAEEVDFATSIQPILAKRCFACHGPDKQEGGIRLDNRETLLKKSEAGTIPIIPGDASKSELMRRIVSGDDSERMPPEGVPLSKEQVEQISRWIQEGANFVPHWAFQPIPSRIPPKVKSSSPIAQPLDAFVLARLEAKRLSLSLAASPAELVRRIYLDVIGLPPSPEVLAELESQWSEQTYERLVDRLLADPAFGDRWARHWLDIVRFAETNSYERDGAKPNAWKYRDYVIQSFSSDKPYDQFIREQLAGDELPEVTTETLTATGFYRLGIWDDEPADPLQARFDEYDDIVTTISQGFLGLTINCARCHDHKIDPLPQTDYYRLVAFVRDVTSYGNRGDQAANNQIDITGQGLSHQYDAFINEIKRLNKRLQKMEQDAILKMSAPDQRATEGPERGKVLKEKLKDYLSEEESKQYAKLQVEKREAESKLQLLPPRERVLGLARCDSKPPATHVLLRGSPHNQGPAVEPGFPKLFDARAPTLPSMPEESKTAGRRRVLADWIASNENWLTSRVIVNRIWQHYFGRGIVGSPNNFGLMGDRPTHPELIDFLATQLVDHDWSLKSIHRQILLSTTYRQSSALSKSGYDIDPENRLYWRQSVRRMSAEQVRDSILAVTGQLNEQQFGESFFQSLSKEVLASQSRPGSGWGDSSPADQARRSVYIHVKRSLPVPMLSAFDFPDADNSCEARFLTIQPGQALGLLNSGWMQEQAAALHQRVEREVGNGLRLQAARALELVTSRRPSDHDITELVELVDRLKRKQNFSETQARRAMCLAALNINQFMYID